jgi:hypothetical protein
MRASTGVPVIFQRTVPAQEDRQLAEFALAFVSQYAAWRRLNGRTSTAAVMNQRQPAFLIDRLSRKAASGSRYVGLEDDPT